jgi:hypothetical protein
MKWIKVKDMENAVVIKFGLEAIETIIFFRATERYYKGELERERIEHRFEYLMAL